MMELVLTGVIAVGVPLWLALEEVVQRRKAQTRKAPEVAPSKPRPEARHAAAAVRVALSREPARG